jgi:hypothetical protein
VNGSGIEAADIRSFQLIPSDEAISVKRSQGLPSGLFGNLSLERLFVGCSKGDIRMNLSELIMEKRIDLKTTDLFVEVLDILLLSEQVSVESDDALLHIILNLGLGDRNRCGNDLSLSDEHFAIPSGCIWHSSTVSRCSPLGSIRESFHSFRRSSHSSKRSNFRFFRAAASIVSNQSIFTADATFTQTH